MPVSSFIVHVLVSLVTIRVLEKLKCSAVQGGMCTVKKIPWLDVFLSHVLQSEIFLILTAKLFFMMLQHYNVAPYLHRPFAAPVHAVVSSLGSPAVRPTAAPCPFIFRSVPYSPKIRATINGKKIFKKTVILISHTQKPMT